MFEFLLGALLALMLPALAFVLVCLWRDEWDLHGARQSVPDDAYPLRDWWRWLRQAAAHVLALW